MVWSTFICVVNYKFGTLIFLMMDALASSLFSYERSLILLIAFESSLLVCRIQRQLDQWDYGFLPERLHERGRWACAYRYFEVSANRCQESLPMLRRTFLQVNLQVLPLPQRFCLLSPDMCRVTLDTVQRSRSSRLYKKLWEPDLPFCHGNDFQQKSWVSS